MTGLDLAIGVARALEAAGAAALFGAPLLLALARTPRENAPFERPLALAAATALGLGSAMALASQTAGMAGSWREGLAPDALASVMSETAFGRSVAVRLACAALASAAALAAPRRPLLAAAGAVALASLAWSGHGAADAGVRGLLHTGGDVVHLLAGGAWLGALAALVALCAAARHAPAQVAVLEAALRRFSGVGSAVVALILVSGLGNAWMLAAPQRWRELPDSAWGRLLLLKAALFVAMLGLAGLNRWRLTPRLASASAGETGATLAALTRSVGLEALLGAGAVAAAAAMGGLAPPAAQG